MNALILIDLQNDFFPGGPLGLSSAHAILPAVRALLKGPFDMIVATKDWHPKDHGSFAIMHAGKKPGDRILLQDAEQTLWPIHCVADTPGADFYPGWDASLVDVIVHKGKNKHVDSYSAFFDNDHVHTTGLDSILKKEHIDRVFIAGLATDYCVKYSALDACKLDFETYVIEDACKGINLHPSDSTEALQEMRKAGVKIISSKDILAGKR